VSIQKRIVIFPSESGTVLLITLALIALITVVVLAYFSRAVTNRRVESSISSAARADALARTSAQIIVSDAKAEIAGGSETLQPSQQMPIYRPTSTQSVIPSRVLARNDMLSDATFNSLVKQSTGRFFPTSYSRTPAITGSSGTNTTIASVNNANVSIARWNAPVLNTGSGFSAADQLPQWVLIDRQGIASNQSWNNNFRDYTPGNDNAVIGRFAFNVYDVGGLLDANVAGYPIFSTALTALQIQQLKSSQAGAYLFDSSGAIIPGFTQTKQQTFVNTWKFPTAGTSSSGTFFLDFMRYPNTPVTTLATTFTDTGFMRPIVRSSTSTTLAYSRQDLIRATQASNAYLTTAALPYFTHFSRELNAPSWFPSQDAADMGGNNGSGNVYAYFTNRDSASASNRFLPNVRVATAFTRADGTQAVVGEPLIKYRFPLRRLSAVSSTGVNTGGFPILVGGVLQSPNSTTVQRDFGLIWDTSADPVTGQAVNRWNYVGATGTTVQNSIATLDQVATAGREPNFFEILKAFILNGSLGLGSGSTRTFVDAETRYFQQPLSADSQIIQIGANIIDQWDTDKNPTFIYLASTEFAGIENLPYLNKLVFQPRWNPSTVFGAWLVPSFWTPAQNAAAVGTQSTAIPAVRFAMTSGTASAVVESSTASAPSATVTGSSSQPYLTLVPSTTTLFPTPDTPTTSSTPNSGVTPNAPNGRLGIPFVFNSTGTVTRANTVRTYPVINNVTFEMQVQILGNSATPWKTYQKWTGCTVNVSSVTSICQPATLWGSSWGSASIYDPEFSVLDPRTMRFGAWETHASATGDTTDFNRGNNETLDRGATNGGFQVITGLGPQGSGFSGVTGNFSGANIANNGTTAPNYSDLDGVRRGGDILSGSDTSEVFPTNPSDSTKTNPDRPPALSREIRTSGELGAIFRDQPWKTLNLTTSDSADAGLLDAFTIFEPNIVFRSDITAGKVSLNTRQSPVLRAVLAGVATNTNSSTPLIDSTDPTQRNAVADALIAMTSSQPMINKSELVTRFAANPSVTALGSKEAREAVIRALSDVGQTRTWNLMIDVIAQAGRFSSVASSVDNFIVQGEKRYWLHVAMDRFTGEVIDQQLELVNE